MKKFISVVTLLLISVVGFSQVKLDQLLCDNRIDPIGIDNTQPEFTWQLISDKRNVLQNAYEIRVGNDMTSLKRGKDLLWSSGKKNSDQSVHVPYSGKPLQSGKKYFWQVRVWDNNGKPSDWSNPASFQMGLLNKNLWKAKWIEPGYQGDTVGAPCPMFRKQFSANKKIVSATAYITAHGLYEAQINGQRVGDAYLTPGWTSYNHRLQYQVYDVSGLLKQGDNAVGIIVGNITGKDLSLFYNLYVTWNRIPTFIYTYSCASFGWAIDKYNRFTAG